MDSVDGIIGVTIAALCCLAPALILFVGAAGLSAWLAGHDYILLACFVMVVAVAACSLFLRQRRKGDN